MACYRLVADGIVLSVRLTPKSSRDVVEGVSIVADGRSVLRVRVRAVADKGAANLALAGVLADTLGVPQSAITLISGATARLKQVHVSGEALQLAAMVDRWIGRRQA